MAERARRAEPDEVQLSLTPMIDIVFNLLIFFLCATKFRLEAFDIPVPLPKDRGLPATATPVVDLNQVRIRLGWQAGAPGQEGLLRVSVADVPLGPAAPAHPRAAVWRALDERLRELLVARGEPERCPVVLDAGPDVPTQHVVSALDAVVAAGVTEVTFAQPRRPAD